MFTDYHSTIPNLFAKASDINTTELVLNAGPRVDGVALPLIRILLELGAGYTLRCFLL